MLLLLVIILLLIETLFLILRRDRRSVLLFLTAASTFVFILGILIYIAKKGGISSETSFLLFGPMWVRRRLQYMVLTLGQLGYIVAVGRYLTPFLLLATSLDVSFFPLSLQMQRKLWAFFILPLLSLILYLPPVFRSLGDAIPLVVFLSKAWIYLYLLIAAVIIIHEFRSITNSYFRHRFITKMLLLFSLVVLYALYAGQDPAQIYLFYSNDYMLALGLWYLSAGLSAPLYIVVMCGSLAAAIAGCYGSFKYMRMTLDEEEEDVRLKRKAKDAALGIGMFIHGTKNELLSSKVLISRIEKRGCDNPEIKELAAINENLLERMNRLYASISPGALHLRQELAQDVVNEALKIAKNTLPEVTASIGGDGMNVAILADKTHLAEAISNIIVNGWEAERNAGCRDPLKITLREERLWLSITIGDKGGGIPQDAQKKIWEPFYSTKNSSSNWGMGMYFARNIVRMHMGSIRFESEKGRGTSFIIFIPKAGSSGGIS